NALPGDATWSQGTDATNHELEGYGDRISAHAGQSVGFRISSDVASSAVWTLYRLGWYGRAGARRVHSGGPISVGPQTPCPVEPVTGLVRCSWPAQFTVDISAADVSGLYALKLVREDGRVRFVPLIV